MGAGAPGRAVAPLLSRDERLPVEIGGGGGRDARSAGDLGDALNPPGRHPARHVSIVASSTPVSRRRQHPVTAAANRTPSSLGMQTVTSPDGTVALLSQRPARYTSRSAVRPWRSAMRSSVSSSDRPFSVSSTVFLTSSCGSVFRLFSFKDTMDSGMVASGMFLVSTTPTIPGRAVSPFLSGRHSAVKVRKIFPHLPLMVLTERTKQSGKSHRINLFKLLNNLFFVNGT